LYTELKSKERRKDLDSTRLRKQESISLNPLHCFLHMSSNSPSLINGDGGLEVTLFGLLLRGLLAAGGASGVDNLLTLSSIFSSSSLSLNSVSEVAAFDDGADGADRFRVLGGLTTFSLTNFSFTTLVFSFGVAFSLTVPSGATTDNVSMGTSGLLQKTDL
jgi:hypothetical protein